MRRDRLWGWIGPLVVFALSFADRLNGLARVRCTVDPATGELGRCFDETYYARDAQSMLRYGYETRPVSSPDPEVIVHPPLGKWMIAAGEQVFGANEFGWRIASVVFGSLTILVFARCVRRMTSSTLLGTLAGLLLSLDGLEFVQSRIATLDIFLLFWIVVALACVVADRDRRGRGGIRWWRWAAGASFGCACAVKWSGAPLLVGLGLLAFSWDVGARRVAGARRPLRAALRRDAPQQVAAMVLLPLVVYAASWTGWFVSTDGFMRHSRGTGVLNTLDSWFQFHRFALCFHEGLADTPQLMSPLLCDNVAADCPATPMTDRACWSKPQPHAYESKPFGWLTLSRPVAYSYDAVPAGTSLDGQSCPAGGPDCSRAVLAVDTPALWWAGLLTLPVVGGLWAARRDWRASTAVVGVLFAFVPWLSNTQRVMFQFYALPMLPFVVLSLVLALGLVLGPPGGSDRRRVLGAAAVGTFTLLVLADFAWLHPVLSGQVITYDAWRARVIGPLGFPGWL